MINWLGGLKKEVHLVKVLGRDQEKYEPSLIITKEKAKGRSFQIPLPAFWKYVDPKDNADALPGDAEEFKKILETANFKMLFYKHMTPEPAARKQAKIDIADWILAATIFKQTKILPCVCWNLVKCLRMFEITVSPASAAQLLLWIQDGLEDMKNYSEQPVSDKVGVAGEMEFWEGEKKLGTKEVTVSEADLLTQEVGGNA